MGICNKRNYTKSIISDSIQEIKDYYESIIEQLPGHIYWKDKNGIILGCNDIQAKSVGLNTAKDMVGLTAYETLPCDQADEITRIDREVILTGMPLIAEEICNNAKGEQRIYFSQKVPLRNKRTQEVIGVLGISIDITAEKEAEKLRQEKMDTEKRISEYLRAAAGSIAHELRTPLAIIGMSAAFIKKYWHILLENYKKTKQSGIPSEDISIKHLKSLESRIEAILKQAHYSDSFIDLILGNLKDGDLDVSNFHIYDMKTLINSCLELYPFDEKEKIFIHWKENQTFQFYGDEFLMCNVLNNLIKNSLFFIKQVGKGDISIWLEHTETHNILYFKDTAKGASAEVVANLFQSFYSKRQGGIGLGLAFCRKIINSFGGSIEASSIEGEFMLFTLSFPVVRGHLSK